MERLLCRSILPSWVLLQVRIHADHVGRIGEQTIFVLKAYLEALVHRLVGVGDIEAAVGLRTILPDYILVSRLHRAEDLVEEVRHLLARFFQVSQTDRVVPAENILEAAAFKPHLEHLLLLQHFHVDIGADSLGTSTFLDHVDILLCLGIVASLQTALGIVEQHLSIAHDNDVVQSEIVAVHAAVIGVAGTHQQFKRQVEALAIESLRRILDANLV